MNPLIMNISREKILLGMENKWFSTVDLQNVPMAPKANASAMFDKNKLNYIISDLKSLDIV